MEANVPDHVWSLDEIIDLLSPSGLLQARHNALPVIGFLIVTRRSLKAFVVHKVKLR
jgi:hypothetical protein